MTFYEGAVLPPVCMLCGEPTTRYGRVIVKMEDENHSEGVLLSLFGGIIGDLLAFASERTNNAAPMSIKLPVCHACKAKEAIKPQYLDFYERTMTFVVHMRFKAAMDDASTADKGYGKRPPGNGSGPG